MRKIIIGDDLIFQLHNLEEMLKKLGYFEIDKATNAVEVVRLYNLRKHDLVIIDIKGMDSFYDEKNITINTFDAIKMIKDAKRDTKVIVVTATPEKKSVTNAILSNADEILVKGFNINKLKEVLTKFYGIKEFTKLEENKKKEKNDDPGEKLVY